MDSQFYPAPPPFPEKRPKKMGYGTKSLLLGFQCLILMIGALIIYALVYSRESTNREVAYSITKDWGGTIYFNGIMAVPDTVSSTFDIPTLFNCDVDVTTQSLHRGIYEAEVYDAEIKASGTLSKNQIQEKIGDNFSLYLGMPQWRIIKLNPVKVCGKEYEWQMIRDSLQVPLKFAELPEDISFETSFTTRGSGGLYVARIGDQNKICFNGEAPNPSFQGSSLPTGRRFGSKGRFEANWETSGRFEQRSPSLTVDEYGIVVEEAEDYGYSGTEECYVGTEFLVGVDRYQKVTRSLKYSFIIILLTYIAVLSVEIIRKRRIPLLNYFLIGVALVIFYSLLLSFVELMIFWLAYLIAAAMTILLISVYIGMLMKSRKSGVIIGTLLTVYYGACFVMLSSTYALLLGSLLLFAAIALLMYATLRLKPR